MEDEELRHWLALQRAPELGPARFLRLVKAFGSLQAVFKASDIALIQQGIPEQARAYLKAPDWTSVDLDLDWQAKSSDQTIITWQDDQYPKLLREIAVPPPLLYIAGNPALLDSLQLAVVGSRNPTYSGIENAKSFVTKLVQTGLTITSGMALGIDGVAHRAALAAKEGQTVAVLGSGIDVIYPKSHKKLAAAIIEQGTLVSELPLGTKPQAQNFPRRNRIISGLSKGVLIIEAALQSGSLITAYHALDQGREVFAIPGSIHNPLAKGCHHILRQGAKLVETVQDILDELNLGLESAAQSSTPVFCDKISSLAKGYYELVQCIGFEPTPVDKIIARACLPVPTALAMLTELELQGCIIPAAGGYQRIIQQNGYNEVNA